MPSKTITYNGIELIVKYSITGKHLPATTLDPEEFPEVKIISITAGVGNVDILPIIGELYQDEIYDIVFDMIMDDENY